MCICGWNGAIFVQGIVERSRRKTHKAYHNIISFSFLQMVDAKCLNFMQTSYLVHACELRNVWRQPTRLCCLEISRKATLHFHYNLIIMPEEATGSYRNGYVCIVDFLCKYINFYGKWSWRMAPTEKMKIIPYIPKSTKHSNPAKLKKEQYCPKNICFKYQP